MSTVLITGGAGYIGTHLAARLLERRSQVVVLDDLSHGTQQAVERAQALGAGWIELEVGDIADPDFVNAAFARWRPQAVVHLAAAKSVAASMADPQGTRRVNVDGTAALASALLAHQVARVVFASTAAVYGDLGDHRADETSQPRPISPYAVQKLEGEQILEAAAEAGGFALVHLRFFNVAGAHPSGQLGEFTDRPENLLPILLRAARAGSPVQIFGTDWPTRDGTCVRDYVHVEDIVTGIEAALAHAALGPGVLACNLGTGTGSTVREVIAAVEQAVGHPLDVSEAPRRPGDPASSMADASRAAAILGWRPTHDLQTIAAHAAAVQPLS